MHRNRCCIAVHWIVIKNKKKKIEAENSSPSWANVWWHRTDTAVKCGLCCRVANSRGSPRNRSSVYPRPTVARQPPPPANKILARTRCTLAIASVSPFQSERGEEQMPGSPSALFFFSFTSEHTLDELPLNWGRGGCVAKREFARVENGEGRLINAAQILLAFHSRGKRCSFRLPPAPKSG